MYVKKLVKKASTIQPYSSKVFRNFYLAIRFIKLNFIRLKFPVNKCSPPVKVYLKNESLKSPSKRFLGNNGTKKIFV